MKNSIIEIRKTFLDFFSTKEHKILESSSLIPKNDSTLLFTNAGMNQFKNIFLDYDQCQYKRVATSQRCVRISDMYNDLENVGYTNHHHTFFEMLGNFSFGDYFKTEAIYFAWELLTDSKWFNLPKDKLIITVHNDDNESYNIWNNKIGVPKNRIIRIGNIKKDNHYVSDNFWQMGDIGPCGPCSEIYYNKSTDINNISLKKFKEKNNDYLEIWNLVFIQFSRHLDGTLKKLSKPSIDTGMGLERITSVIQNVNSNYDIDLFKILIFSIAKKINIDNLKNKSLRVLADHIRSCVFLIYDGVIPSSNGRGYILRRIIRRAALHGIFLNIKGVFFYKLVHIFVNSIYNLNDNIKMKEIMIETTIKKEEEKFSYTLMKGLKLLKYEISKLDNNILDGKKIFLLYDTYGFPIDLIIDICRENKIYADILSFNSYMNNQRNNNKLVK